MRVLAIALFLLEGLAFCQTYPAGQYPPQYPPGQDPSQYPPGQYPPNQYPARLPGGIPIGIPVPQINLPKRKPKEDKKEDPSGVKITLASVDGALRKLGEKDLLLETNPTRILKFRLLVKTQFKDSEGEPVRDSLLHPGDRLSIQVNADDAETALKVILLRAGSGPEREAASKPVEEAKIATPTNDDLTNVRTTLAHETAAPSPSSPETPPPADRPTIAERPDLDRPPTQPVSRMPASGNPDEIISDAREAAVNFTADLPNFLVQQVTTRYQSNTRAVNWQAIDTVTADVACVNGKEDYRNIAINGRPTSGPVERTGTWSTGEFAVTLQDILAPATAATFMKQREEMLGSRSAYVFDLAVEQSNSHWVLVGPTGRQYRPAYKGTIWIDKDTRRVLRIEQIAKSAQSTDVPYDKAESVVEYGFVNIEGKSYLLPTQSENLACLRGSSSCVRNVIEFRNYRKFSASSDIKYDKFRATF
jgi:hypothetical protein